MTCNIVGCVCALPVPHQIWVPFLTAFICTYIKGCTCVFYACFRFRLFCMLLPYSHVGSPNSSHHIDDGKGVDYESKLLVRQKRVQQHKQQSWAQMAPDPPLLHHTPHSQGEGDKAGTREGRIKVPQERRSMCCVKEHRCKDEAQKNSL